MTIPAGSDATIGNAGTAPSLASAGLCRLLRRVSHLAGAGEHEQLRRNAILAFLVRIASAVIMLASQVVMARWMGGFEYGVFVIVWTWVLVLGEASTLGLSTAMIRLLPEYGARGEFALARGLLRGGRFVALAFSTTISLAGALALTYAGSHLDRHFILPAYLALVCVPLVTLSDLQDGIGRACGWIGTALLPPYVLRPLLLLLAMAAAQVSGLDVSAATAMACAAIATAVAAVVQLIAVARRVRAAVPAERCRFAPGTWLRTSLPLLAIAACEVLQQNADILVIARYLPPSETAVYFAALKTMSVVLFVYYAVASAIARRLPDLNARGDRRGLEEAVGMAVNWTFWPSLAAALALLAAGKPLLWLFGPEFVEGHPLMFILAAGFLARAAVGPSEFVLNMLGEQKLCAAILAATATFNVLLSLALVPRCGLAGAAAANAIALAAGAAMNASAARRRLGIRLPVWRNLSGGPGVLDLLPAAFRAARRPPASRMS